MGLVLVKFNFQKSGEYVWLFYNTHMFTQYYRVSVILLDDQQENVQYMHTLQ